MLRFWNDCIYSNQCVCEGSSTRAEIPFGIVFPEPEITREKAMQTFMLFREQSEKNFPQGISLDEINEEIRKARYGEENTE